MMKFFKGYSSDSELSTAITRLLSLDKLSGDKLAKSRWLFSESMMNRMFKSIRRALKAQPSLLEDIPTPLVVIGDLHGDMYTLIGMIKHHGMPPKTNYLFLGDYVDRGPNGVETFLLPLLLTARFPGHCFSLRGNHESIMMSRCYGFLEECRNRYSTRIYMSALKCFDLLPVAGIIAGKVFAVHGGLSPHMDSLEDIARIQRPAKLQPGTLLTDVIWGDPTLDDLGEDFTPSDRGAGYFFSEEPCKRFLMDNGFVAMVRAHEVVAKGARVHFGCCWTVFSHPRYMGLRNVAATLVITNDLEFVPHFFPFCYEDLELLAGHPLAAEDEMEPSLGMLAEESVIGDWADEDDDFGETFDDGSTFLGHPQHSAAVVEATVDYTCSSVPTESPPSLYGTEASSPSIEETAQGSPPTFRGAGPSVGVAL